MLQSPRRTGLGGPTLVRLLARLKDADAPEAGQSLALQLSQWLDWTEAIALSSALKAQPAPVTSRAPALAAGEEQECARVRAALTAAVAEATTGGSPARRRGAGRPVIPDAVDASVAFAAYRRRYVTVQQTMETAIGDLRGRLRTTLAARGAEMTRLAMVDAVMERVLAPREQSLLAAVPTLLEARFDQLRQGEPASPAGGAERAEGAAAKAPPPAPGAWTGVFRAEMQSVLLAELDIRFQPVEGLLAALCGS